MSVVDCGWYNNRISGIIVSVLPLSVVDCGWYNNRISGIIVSVLALSVVDCGWYNNLISGIIVIPPTIKHKYHFIVNKLNYYYTQIMMFKICLPLSMVCKNYNFSVELHTQSLSIKIIHVYHLHISELIQACHSPYLLVLTLLILLMLVEFPELCMARFL